MFKIQVFLCCFLTLCAAKRVYYLACGLRGFSCSPTEIQEQTVTYECPSDANDVLLLINDFKSAPNITSLIIKNCKELTISFQCSRQARNIKFLHILNIETLKIQQDPQYQTQLPTNVILENINYVENIPSFSFSQIDKSSHNVECFKPENDFKMILVVNVRIGTVHSNGFYMPNDFSNVFLRNVTIDRLRSSAFLTKMSDPYIFQIEDSSLGIVESGAIQVSGKALIFKNNTFGDISSIGINGKVQQFYFCNNLVKILQPHAISVISPAVSIWENTFKNMKSRALEKISPGLLSGNSGGNFTYKFFFNEIEHMDANCLHPDFEAYEQVPTNFFVKVNKILCSCENSAWLFSNSDHDQKITSIERFNRLFLTATYFNACSSSCKLTIANTKRMIHDGKCMDNITTEWLCQNPI